MEHDLSVRIESLQPGAHTVTASWGHGTAQLAVDGGSGTRTGIGDVVLAAGSDVLVGSPGNPGTTFHTVVLSASPPAP